MGFFCFGGTILAAQCLLAAWRRRRLAVGAVELAVALYRVTSLTVSDVVSVVHM